MGFIKRNREVILVAALLVLPLGVYFAHARHPSERSRLDRMVLALTAPMEKGVSRAVGAILNVWNGYIALHHAHERARELERQVSVLKLKEMEFQRVKEENDRLHELLAFAQATPDWRVVGARVIGVRLDPKGLQVITIDRGSEAGIVRMMPVMVGGGVVGRVHAVASSTADVLVLTDRNSSIAVRVERSRARANVRGTGSPESCRLEYALRSDDIAEGDVLVTSGTDGVFPRGLLVGKVTGLKRSGQGLYQRADVAPAANVTKLEEVLVLFPSEERPPAKAAGEAPQAAESTAGGKP